MDVAVGVVILGCAFLGFPQKINFQDNDSRLKILVDNQHKS